MKTIFPLLLFTTILCSCFEKTGCHDYNALNYDSDVERTDHSCIYRADISIFWFSNEYLGYMLDSGSTSLDFYLDNKFLGNKDADNFVTAGPYCDNNNPNVMNIVDTIYYDQVYKKLKVIDQSGKMMYDYSVQILPGCNLISLEH